MKRIQLPDDSTTTIDDQDEALITGYKWRILKVDKQTYVHAWHGYQHIYMHRLIMGAPKGKHVDHEDGNGLNNQRSNLRIASPSQNHANRGPDTRKAGKSSKYKGVYFVKRRSKWAATIHINGKTISLGQTFLSEEEAATAYDRAAIEAWGPFARTNAAMFGLDPT